VKKESAFIMDKKKTDAVIDKFMHPTVFTGVKPLFLLAEEVSLKEQMGDIIDVVWVHWTEENTGEFTYITKFAVRGKIIDRGYHTPDEMAPFKNRLALPNEDNLEKMALHIWIKEEITEVQAKRNALAKFLKKDFDLVPDVLSLGEEVSLFKKAYGDWKEPFYDILIESAYGIVETNDTTLTQGEYKVKHPKTGVIKKYIIENEFYAYIIGSKADIAGLHLKDDSYKKSIELLQDKARAVFSSIEWLYLNDPRVKAVKEHLPRHPFDDYFSYVKKEDVRKLSVPNELMRALELMIEEHMPKVKGPMGIEYIPIDNLLYLFHEVIPRAEALLALEACDIICEPATVILGIEGKRELPPKFLVSLPHVVSAYQKFPRFIEACERYFSL